jgi:hypothetical protein
LYKTVYKFGFRKDAVMDDRELESLTNEILELCGHMDAAEFRLLELIRRLDEIAGGAWEMKSCAHWLNWRCGIALGAAREKVRVAHALVALPAISGAFREGRLSYPKVRAITRVATPENEATFVQLCLSATAAQIEKIVQKYRLCERIQAARTALGAYDARTVTHYWADDGSLVLQGRLPPEIGAVVAQALERASEGMDPDAASEQRRADALGLLAERYLAAPGESNGAAPVGDRFQVTVHVSAETLRQDGALDPDDPPEIEDGPVLAPDTVRRLACEAPIVALVESASGEPLAVGRKTRLISPGMRRALKQRDGGCRFPGCPDTRFVDAHHIEHWADGGETRLDNLVLLCRPHHRLLHEGGCRIERCDDELRFLDARGTPIPITAEKRSRGNVVELMAAHHDLGIDHKTTTPDMGWERPDYSYILSVIRPYQEPGRSRGNVGDGSVARSPT